MNKEDYKLLPLAAVGAAQGFFKYYVQPELTYKRAWAVIGATVLLHDVFCGEGQTLSEGADKALEKHPVAVTAGIGVVALHLANILPPNLDPIHRLVGVFREE